MLFKYINSTVKGHEGPCIPTWLNHNQIYNRLDGGVTGFFRLVIRYKGINICRTGPEFHGMIKNGEVVSTALELEFEV
jgi:hypothetical protein